MDKIEARCCVKGCKNEEYGGWIDIWDDKSNMENPNFGRMPFCKEHFEKVFPYIEKKEKQATKESEPLEDGTKMCGWFAVPLSVVEEGLKQ